MFGPMHHTHAYRLCIPGTPRAAADAGRPAGCRPALATLVLLCALAGCSQQTSEAARRSDELGCMRCHGMVNKFVGPGFAQIAARYRGDPTASARLRHTIRQGSVGTWGSVIMPRQPQVSEADAELLAEWVLGQPASE